LSDFDWLMVRYMVEELLALFPPDVTLPRAMRKSIFRLRPWLPLK